MLRTISSRAKPTALRVATTTVRAFSTQLSQSHGIPEANYDMGPSSEFSVVYTNRALNHMAPPFKKVMVDLNSTLTSTYNCARSIIMPGSGSHGMEAVARQFASSNDHVVVLRNGWFSYRWTELFDQPNAAIVGTHTVLKAQCIDPDQHQRQYKPADVDMVCSVVAKTKPKVFFCPHVETSTGIMLPDDYIKKVAAAVHANGGLFVLDCIASGTVWNDMTETGVDVIISAPQKGWTGPAGAALVMLSQRAQQQLEQTCSSSFVLSLNKWDMIMESYLNGGFAYHTTMPTDALREFHNVTKEMEASGMDYWKAAQIELGIKARAMIESKGLKSVAADGYQAPGVLVFYSPEGMDNPTMVKKFLDNGMQIAMGVPWMIDEGATQTWRIGLFGVDKLNDIDGTVKELEVALDKVMKS
jgi:aspartate aminotransferase-like enzyme